MSGPPRTPSHVLYAMSRVDSMGVRVRIAEMARARRAEEEDERLAPIRAKPICDFMRLVDPNWGYNRPSKPVVTPVRTDFSREAAQPTYKKRRVVFPDGALH
jgi:hypothetical protein